MAANEDGPRPKSTKKNKTPETFRERVIKTSEAKQSSDKPRPVRNNISKVSGPVRHRYQRLIKIQPFKAIASGLHIVGRILVPGYVRGSVHELQLVSWPDWPTSRRLTYAVIVFAIVFGGAIAIVDYGLDKVFKYILLK